MVNLIRLINYSDLQKLKTKPLKKIVLLSFLGFLWTTNVPAQQENLLFNFTFQEQALNLGQKYYSGELNDTLQIDRLKLYIGQLSFWKGNQEVYRLEKEYHLLDASNEASLEITYPPGVDFDQIRFRLGVDSLTNVAGVQGGDLDPTQGMYWAWQSGYINFKLEGTSPICPGRNNRFQYHLGGFQAPFASSQEVHLNIEDLERFKIDLPVDGLLEVLDLREAYQIMSPRKTAVELSEWIADLFKVSYED